MLETSIDLGQNRVDDRGLEYMSEQQRTIRYRRVGKDGVTIVPAWLVVPQIIYPRWKTLSSSPETKRVFLWNRIDNTKVHTKAIEVVTGTRANAKGEFDPRKHIVPIPFSWGKASAAWIVYINWVYDHVEYTTDVNHEFYSLCQ